MLQVYSNNIEVAENTPIPLNNVVLKKGCTAEVSGVATIALNKCGVYCIMVNSSSATAATIQLYENGVAQPQAESVGASASFNTYVQVESNNTRCPCSAPKTIQIVNTGAETTFTNFNVLVTKVV